MSEVTPSPAARSVYQRVLGDDFALLEPRLQRYFGPFAPGVIGRGVGVYEVAGSRCRVLWPVWAFLGWRRVLFPELGTDVPFTVVNRPGPNGALSAMRTFRFPRVERVMEDTMSVVDGRLIDRIGRRRGLEVSLALTVRDGGLTMKSGRFWLRIAGMRIPLPTLAVMTLDERTRTDDLERQQVDVRITAPLFGEVFRYSGSFTYSHVDASE